MPSAGVDAYSVTVVLDGEATPDLALTGRLHNGGGARGVSLVLHDGSAASSRYEMEMLHASFSGTATQSSGNRTLILDLGHLSINGQTVY